MSAETCHDARMWLVHCLLMLGTQLVLWAQLGRPNPALPEPPTHGDAKLRPGVDTRPVAWSVPPPGTHPPQNQTLLGN